MSDYVVDVNNPAEPLDSRDAWKMAAEMRALKAKMIAIAGDVSFAPGSIMFMARGNTPAGWFQIPPTLTTMGYHVGKASSLATLLRGDQFLALFQALWTDPGLQLYNPSGQPISKGINADSDWNADAMISIPPIAGRVLAHFSSGPYHPSGELIGEYTHQLSVAEMPSHTHGIQVYGGNDNPYPDRLGDHNNEELRNKYNPDPAGGDQPHNNIQPTYFMIAYIKL